MAEKAKSSIGLAELIAKVKEELLSVKQKDPQDTPFFFVDSVDLELQVTVNREGSTGIKIDVVTMFGGEIGGSLSQEDIHTIKVHLSPLLSKETILEDMPDDLKKHLKAASQEAFIKGSHFNDPNQLGA